EVGDDGRVHCMRVESPVPSTRGGGWWHNVPQRREGDVAEAAAGGVHEPPPRPPEPARAAPATRDAVYRAILAACARSGADRAYLDACGLAADALGGYGTLPPRGRQQPILVRLLSQFGREALLTVPGIAEGEGGLQFTLGGGLLVAVRGLEGRIDALTVRQ